MIPQALGFFGWKRPQVAAKTLRGLARCHGIERWPLIAFLDAGSDPATSGRGRRTPATSGNEEAPVCLADRGQPHENKTFLYVLRWKGEWRLRESQSLDAEGRLGDDVMADTCAFSSSEERLRYFNSVRIDESSWSTA